jgi:hypothetical protein
MPERYPPTARLQRFRPPESSERRCGRSVFPGQRRDPPSPSPARDGRRPYRQLPGNQTKPQVRSPFRSRAQRRLRRVPADLPRYPATPVHARGLARPCSKRAAPALYASHARRLAHEPDQATKFRGLRLHHGPQPGIRGAKTRVIIRQRLIRQAPQAPTPTATRQIDKRRSKLRQPRHPSETPAFAQGL